MKCIDRPGIRCRNSSACPRGGYLYVGVMLVAVIVGLIGLTSARVGRFHLHSAVEAASAVRAESLSRSAIEHGMAQIQNDDAWRTTLEEGTEYPQSPVTMNGGTWTWKLIDSDGDLTDDDSDFIQIVGIGRSGNATIAQSVQVYPTGEPLPVMDYGLHADLNISVEAGTTVSTNRTVSSNASLSGPSNALISGNAEATIAAPCPVSGNLALGTPARRSTGSSVFEYYQTRGTDVPVSGLPLVSGVRVMENIVLSPTANPYGTSSAAGIYIMDCGGQTVSIRNCRVAGTLLLLNPGNGTDVSGAVLWQPHIPGYPALLVDGALTINLTSLTLSESVLGTNFNPVGTPYQEEEDVDTSDSYTTDIGGVIYISEDLDVPLTGTATALSGTTIVAGTVAIQASSTFNFNSVSLLNPPPGFAFGNPMKIVPGSQRRIALP